MKNLIQSTFTAMALGFLFSIPYAAPTNAAAKFDDTLNPMAIAKLPVCNSNSSGSRASINDFAGSATWNGAVGVGGGTGTASVYCDGGSWKVAVGGGGSGPTTQAVAMVAPITNQGNYGTATCTNTAFINDGAHHCLTFDDHWTTSVLQNGQGGTTKFWFEGMFVCNNQAGGLGAIEACGADNTDGVNTIAYPFTSFGLQSGLDGVFTSAGYASGVSNVTGAPTPMQKVADGSLQFTITANTFIDTSPTYCQGSWCSSSKWVSAALTSGGLNPDATAPTPYPAVVANTAAIIPGTGGMVQWRARYDSGLQFGVWPGVECDGVGTNLTTKGNQIPNANFEFGYNYSVYTGNPLTAVAFGTNDTSDDNAIFGTNSGFFGVTTGDTSPDGSTLSTQSGDVRNWHTYGLEWTGTAWQSYVDGVRRQGPISEGSFSATPNVGWQCFWTFGAAESDRASFHTVWDSSLHPGPYNMWISDVQFYRKPNT